MKIALGIIGAEDPEIYAPITATNPTVFVPLQYAVNPDTDEQILFQDAACTVPVTAIGQQIGGVMWDGVIVAVQTTDARRPLWLGEQGAYFDGVDDFLSVAFASGGSAHSVSMSWRAAGELEIGDRMYAAGSTASNVQRRLSEQLALRTSSTTELRLSNQDFSEFQTLIGVHDTTSILRQGASEMSDDIGAPADISSITIASRGGADNAVINCRWMAIYDSAIDLSTRTVLEDAA